MGEKQKTTSNKKENQYGIKIGDIFCMSKLYTTENVHFFQVVELKGKTKIVIKELELEEVGRNGKIYTVMPSKNNFKKESHFVQDNSVGGTKLVQCYNGNIYISVSMRYYQREDGSCDKLYIDKNAYLWDGEPREDDDIIFLE